MTLQVLHNGSIHHFGVDLRGANAVMAQQTLQRSDVDTALEQQPGLHKAGSVEGDVFLYTRQPCQQRELFISVRVVL